jgi:hypothetical protein
VEVSLRFWITWVHNPSNNGKHIALNHLKLQVMGATHPNALENRGISSPLIQALERWLGLSPPLAILLGCKWLQ